MAHEKKARLCTDVANDQLETRSTMYCVRGVAVFASLCVTLHVKPYTKHDTVPVRLELTQPADDGTVIHSAR